MIDPLPANTTASKAQAASHYSGRTQDGIKDTFESIIVALILAFVFRAFIVEAFVIPTGSMAPTLYGAHGTIVCADCGTEFAYGLRDLDDPRMVQPVKRTATAVCPNCNHPNSDLRVSDDQMNPERGDRILVLKWPLDVDGNWFRPHRWEVTVFKDPADGLTNFIKRMAGLPNEVLMILQGDVYTADAGQLSPETKKVFADIRREKYDLLTGKRTGRLRAFPVAVMEELEAKLRIARKSESAQQSLWCNVYDHDHAPIRIDANQPQWIASAAEKSGWNTTSRMLRFEDKGIPDDSIELINGNFEATAAYNIFERNAPPVSDQRVSFVLIPKTQSGSVAIRLSKLGRSFAATVGFDGQLKIEEAKTNQAASDALSLNARIPALSTGKAVTVSFENLDYRLSLRLDGKEVLASSDEPGAPGFYGPNVHALRATRLEQPPLPPRISAAGGSFELLHALVQRDVHYFNDSRFNSLSGLSWAPAEGWGSPNHPILLGPDEYFMLGDNTAASKDSRLWDQIGPHLARRGEQVQLGAVPGDQLIGRAFFVYWPSGYRIDWLPVLNRYGIIPDVGRMRWIR